MPEVRPAVTRSREGLVCGRSLPSRRSIDTHAPCISLLMLVAPWLVMSALVALLLLVHASAKWARAEWVVKPAAALTFIVTCAVFGDLSSTYGKVVFAGLCLAAIGDVLLIPKGEKTFLAGLVSFLLGHVAYGVAFVVRGIALGPFVGGLVVVALVGVPIVRWLWPHVKKPMRGPVVAYVIVITSMVALAAGATGNDGATGPLLGASMFYVSDLSVARDNFVKRELRNRLWGLPLYFFAQMVLAWTTRR